MRGGQTEEILDLGSDSIHEKTNKEILEMEAVGHTWQDDWQDCVLVATISLSDAKLVHVKLSIPFGNTMRYYK